MSHFRTTIDPPTITVTAAALGPDVWPSLKMARAALHDAVDAAIKQANADLAKGTEALKLAHAERVRDLRAGRDAALKMPEAKLESDEPPFQTIGEQTAEIARQVNAGATGPVGGEQGRAA